MGDTTTLGQVAKGGQGIAGAVTDIFAGFAALQSSKLQAKGLQINAEGLRIKAQGDIAEAGEYDLASVLARDNEEYTKQSQIIQQAQLDRQINLSIGEAQANIGGSGLKQSGSAIALLADSASQGALAKHVLEMQGHIQEEGYEEQAKSYDLMAGAARMSAAGEMGLAAQTESLAQQTVDAGKKAATGDFISGGVKGALAIATMFV